MEKSEIRFADIGGREARGCNRGRGRPARDGGRKAGGRPVSNPWKTRETGFHYLKTIDYGLMENTQ